jgi:hypothetical protein
MIVQCSGYQFEIDFSRFDDSIMQIPGYQVKLDPASSSLLKSQQSLWSL